jgi:hypothetical protein
MNRPVTLDKLMNRGLLWRGRREAIDAGLDTGIDSGRFLPTGIAGLDELLGGGWPRAALSEMLGRQVSGLSLWLPALASLSAESRWLAWINPPHLPYAPALAARGIAPGHNLLIRHVPAAQLLWASEQTLRSGHCAAVLFWPPRMSFAQLRRLQLAAERGDCLGVLFRSQQMLDQASPTALRLAVEPEAGEPGAYRVRVLKRRGAWSGDEAKVVSDIVS